MVKYREKLYGPVVLCLLIIVVWCDAQSSRRLKKNASPVDQRGKRQVSCGTSSFICDSGQCIDYTKVCDGSPDCQDSSDETRKTCQPWNRRCPPYAFQCSYGACIDGDKKCDGKVDCVDESDEKVFGCSSSIKYDVTSAPSSGSNCQPTEFTCASGQCISELLICDGKKDCNDGTDETAARCGQISCPPFSFRCAYGACIDLDGKCNGVADCADSSDEDRVLCGTTRPVTPISQGEFCLMPEKPANGNFIVNGCEDGDSSSICQKVPGTAITTPLLLTFSCNLGYQVKGNERVICYGGKWTPSLPECVPATCPPLVSTSVIVRCSHNGASVSCDMPMAAGTEAQVECKVAYQLPTEPGYRKIYCSANGQWNPPLFTCTPVCGVRTGKGKPAVSHGRDAEVGEFPWHVGVYRNSSKDGKYQQICGGSLISDKLVVSAAHCFWDDKTKKSLPKERFKFAVGKYTRDFYFPDEEVQIADPKDIVIEERYQGRTSNYASDIAVIHLTVSVDLNWAVSPVCIDWNNDYERFQLVPGNVGSIAGWGITEEQKPSQIIQTAQLPFVDFDTCWKTVPERFQTYITRDKFCAGYTNGTSVCPGDSGGGLVFQTDKIWYLRGIVSVGVAPEGDDKCFTEQFTAFTQVSQFRDFLKENARRRQ